MIDLYLLTATVNAVTAFSLGLFVYLKGKRPLHRCWFLMGVCVAAWASLVGVERLVMDQPLHLKLDRIEHSFAIWIAVFYLHTIMYVVSPRIPRRQRITLKLIYAATFGLAALVPTPLFVRGAQPQPLFDGRLYDVAGPLYFLFPLLYTVIVVYASILLLRAIRKTFAHQTSLKLLLMGTGLGFLLGGTCFPLVFNVQFPPLGFHFVWLYTMVVAYAIFRHQLWDIQVVVRKSLVYSILVTLLTAGYFGLVYGIEWMLRASLGYSSIWFSLVAFALMALAFQPLKLGIQRFVDHLIFRAPQQAIAKKLEVYEERVREGDRYKAVATLAAGIAHELKNPLTSIKTFLEFFPERHDDPAFRDQFLMTVGSSVERLEQITHGLLDFSKPQAIHVEPVDLKVVLDDVLALTHHELQKKALTVTAAYTHNGSVVHGDAAKLKQCFLNLILNAKEAMASGGTLTVFTGAVNGHLEVHIADTGCGIHPKDLPHLFEPFFSKKPNGHGLGLSIVRDIVREHHGTVAVHSTPGRGTTFTIRLPVQTVSA